MISLATFLFGTNDDDDRDDRSEPLEYRPFELPADAQIDQCLLCGQEKPLMIIQPICYDCY